jgi:hypothetical protein
MHFGIKIMYPFIEINMSRNCLWLDAPRVWLTWMSLTNPVLGYHNTLPSSGCSYIWHYWKRKILHINIKSKNSRRYKIGTVTWRDFAPVSKSFSFPAGTPDVNTVHWNTHILSHSKSIAKGNMMVDLVSFHLVHVTNLLLNFGSMFPGSLGYFASQKRFHTNSKRKSSWCDVSTSKG